MFESLIPLFSIAMALMLGAISPGPSFIYVAQNSISKSRKHGLFTALGTGTGAALFGLLAVMGLQAVLLAVPSAYLILKIGGGLYLLWLAFKIIKHAKEPIAMENDGKSRMTYKQAYRYGLITQLSNPKIAVVLASVFTALLPKEIPNYYYVALPVICFMIDAGWYSCVAMLLSSEKPRKMYLKAKTGVDRVAGSIVTLLGLKLIFFK
ncbi:LysE family translocator [Acinetobacter pittii]|uniref:LysE family translocator n=1 Tax=Acinetobacter geminorum TaxID=2730922 RepID=A0ABT8Z939_9GAMM|nr:MULTISPECIES: LysE family translocator [Acinetobacter]MCU4361742.1 LysE family translocator [Acinetobacter sp. WU_MDCI_Abxc22]MDO7246139.1 LysE family translocator [Acinetobacter pittii]MDO7360876.1 LysE family translocator [Acinetobacter geminorum]MEB6625651.1 LysE family translocator [Acinetobacter pittii]MEB7641139.1 LysE family translocator [Acinetobacter pittii]